MGRAGVGGARWARCRVLGLEGAGDGVPTTKAFRLRDLIFFLLKIINFVKYKKCFLEIPP